MLRDVYLAVGLGWTLMFALVVLLTALSWLMAVAGIVTRPMRARSRALLLGLLTLLPPAAIVVLGRFVAITRSEYRANAMRENAVPPAVTEPVLLSRRRMKAVA